jgi:hypothetical protein
MSGHAQLAVLACDRAAILRRNVDALRKTMQIRKNFERFQACSF